MPIGATGGISNQDVSFQEIRVFATNQGPSHISTRCNFYTLGANICGFFELHLLVRRAMCGRQTDQRKIVVTKKVRCVAIPSCFLRTKRLVWTCFARRSLVPP